MSCTKRALLINKLRANWPMEVACALYCKIKLCLQATMVTTISTTNRLSGRLATRLLHSLVHADSISIIMLSAKPPWTRCFFPLTATMRWTSSAHHAVTRTAPSTTDHPSPKQFKDIPGPKGYPLIGTALDYREDKYRISRVMKRRLDKYGPIYRETIFPGLPEQLVIFDPKDVETVFRADSEWPHRPSGGEVFKRLLKETGLTDLGLFISQGEQWQKMRSPMSKFMMVPRKVAEYHGDFNKITLDLLKNIDMKRDPTTSVLSDVPSHLFNWSFESVAYFILGKRLGALSSNGEVSPKSQEFITAVRSFFVDFADLMFALPLYKVYPTKLWKKVVGGNVAMHKLARHYIDERLAEIEKEAKKAFEAASGEEEAPDKVDFLTYLVHSGKMSLEEVTVNIVDLLSAGVETTSYTLVWTLYCLGNNPEAQEKLRNEIQSVVGSDEIEPAHINEMNYLRNVFKETLRLYPIAGLTQRILQQDIVLSGYEVPNGTEVTMPHTIVGRMPELFSEPDSFLPERWSKENKDKLPSMFAQLPFGFGPRMCIGRRVAELELYIALVHLIRTYKVEYLEKEPMDYVQNFLLKPERQLDLVFKNI